MAAVARPGSKYLIREINEALVLDVLRVQGPTARSQIARLTGLSPATITGITAKLIEAGMILEVSQGQSTGGRRPKILSIHPSGGHVIGARLSEDRIIAATVNLVGEVVDQHAMPWQGRSPTHAQEALTSVVDTLLARSPSPVMGLGLALSGVVDHGPGIVRHSGALGWEEVPLGAALSQRLGMPVTIDNLVTALAATHTLFGEGRGIDHLLVVSIGHSINLALVLNGRIYRGSPDAIGSFAHTSVSVLDDGGRPCHCGARGCLETVASEWALSTELARTAGVDIDTAAALAETDKRIQQIFQTGGRALGRAVANVAKVINPQRIILGGEGTRLGPPLLEPFRKELHQALFGTASRDVDLHITHADEVTWARGAACQLLTELFQVSQARHG